MGRSLRATAPTRRDVDLALSGKLWPAHPKPLPDELLSSWIVRIAAANGVKLNTLTRQLFGPDLTPWNRDIDRNAPEWLLRVICARTGVPRDQAVGATLHGYQGRVFPKALLSGQLRWILPVKVWGPTRLGYGVQYCPLCLAEGQEPYFRRAWRIGFYTFCPIHHIMLHDACPACGAAVALHRRDIGKRIDESKALSHCHVCQYDYRLGPFLLPPCSDADSCKHHSDLLFSLQWSDAGQRVLDIGYIAVLHQLCKVITSRSNGKALLRYVAKMIGAEVRSVQLGRRAFEARRIDERHYVVTLALWILMSPEERLRKAWEEKAVKYSPLLHDLHSPPIWYTKLVCGLARRENSLQDR